MRIFLAGASGVIGLRLLPVLVADGHEVAAMTRSPQKADQLRALGGEPVVCDVFDRDALSAAVTSFAPEMVMHQLTDLPDRLDELRDHAARNDRMRTEGTRNLIAAATAAGASRFLAQSIAWRPPGTWRCRRGARTPRTRGRRSRDSLRPALRTGHVL
jgi:nucleoside-diphosphate-sugar epimerase